VARFLRAQRRPPPDIASVTCAASARATEVLTAVMCWSLRSRTGGCTGPSTRPPRRHSSNAQIGSSVATGTFAAMYEAVPLRAQSRPLGSGIGSVPGAVRLTPSNHHRGLAVACTEPKLWLHRSRYRTHLPGRPQKRAARLPRTLPERLPRWQRTGARLAPSTATLATRRAVGKDWPVRCRMRRGGLTAIVRRSPPRRCTWQLGLCRTHLRGLPRNAQRGSLGRPQKTYCDGTGLGPRLSPAASRLGFSESYLEYHLGLSRQLPLRVSVSIPPHDEELLRGLLPVMLECLTLSFRKSCRKSLRITLLRINIFIHRPMTRDSQTRSETEGKIKGWGHVGSKFVIRHFFFGAKRDMVGAD
jgi:hypothetical protein